ncbi:protein S100-P-like [Alosa pseudoharengus]|uniref:protein S100-P-like n=1 Tax=Alosa pseudoharengus TaxID=34774 RepID=UPI003F8B7655
MTRLLNAMGTLIDIFQEYAGQEGDAKTLSKGELKTLLSKELGMKLEAAKDKPALDKIFKDLDSNADGTVDFTEFITMVAVITSMLQSSK